MGIVFDEVVGKVEPETATKQPEGTDTAKDKEPATEKMRHELSRLEQREARLRAD